MRRNLLIVCLCWVSILLFAQQDPVVMRINGTPIMRSEFERAYREEYQKSRQKWDVKAYADLFINQRLKVWAAKSAGLDTLPLVKKQVADFRAQLLQAKVLKRAGEGSGAATCQSKAVGEAASEQVYVLQITRYLPQNITTNRFRVEELRMDSVYKALVAQSTSVDFQQFVQLFSDEKKALWIQPLSRTKEFEKVAFSLPVGEISQPFASPEGIHIIQVIDRQADSGVAIQQMLTKEDQLINQAYEDLKSEYGYTPDPKGVAELLEKGETTQTLFVLGGEAYTGEMFKRFAQTADVGVQKQLDYFIKRSVFNYKNRLLEKNADFCQAIQAYQSELLVREVTYQKLDSPIKSDTTALRTYFQFHRSNYRWDTPRFRGAVIHCADKKMAKKVKNMLKKKTVEEWPSFMEELFKSSQSGMPHWECGLFAEGDNSYVDKKIFKKKGSDPLKSHPFTLVLGEKQKGPGHYAEVAEVVERDYKTFLNTYWMKQLRAAFKVEINQEVLKTVNNI